MPGMGGGMDMEALVSMEICIIFYILLCLAGF